MEGHEWAIRTPGTHLYGRLNGTIHYVINEGQLQGYRLSVLASD